MRVRGTRDRFAGYGRRRIIAPLDTSERESRLVMVFLMIMLGALGAALLAGWVTWRREEDARQDALSKQEEAELEERRLRGLRSKDGH